MTLGRRNLTIILIALYVGAVWVRLESLGQFEYPYFAGESGTNYRHAHSISADGSLPSLDTRASWPEGFSPAKAKPNGMEYFTGFAYRLARPFSDIAGGREYLKTKTSAMRSQSFDPDSEKARYHAYMTGLQALVGETVVIDFSLGTGFCDCWSKLGLEIFSYLYAEDPQVIEDAIAACTWLSVRTVEAAADPALSPVVLIAEDFASTTGSIFSPALLRRLHFPYLRQLTPAWHAKGMKVLYHSDGNWKRLVPELAACGVDGFYCLEPALGMDLVALRQAWPNHTWAGGVDGVDLMERGTPEQVRCEVRRQVLETGALAHGGVFIGSSSEINPPVRVENFAAMVASVGEMRNPAFNVQERRPTPLP